MKFTRLLTLFLLCAATLGATAQEVTVSPIPQSIVWGENAFDRSSVFVLNGETTADQDAVTLLKGKIATGETGIELIIGEKGDASVQSVEAEIPSIKEGYYLKVEPGKVIIAGTDNAGTYYGVQTFLQIVSAPQVISCTVKDYPNVADRGLVEGYYGNPYSLNDRLSMFEFFGKNKMNVYIYGPKDDVYHRASWATPYPTVEAAKIQQQVAAAHKNKVQFVWAIHPSSGMDWSDSYRLKIVAKFEQMYQLGVRAYAVFFDDISGDDQSAANQAALLNYLDTAFVQKKPDVAQLILCPTQYNRSWSSGNYLSILGSQMNPNIRVMWTGNSVVDMINKTDMDWINTQIKRNAYIWLNYPVTDYCVDHLLMGPTYGNDTNISNQLSGFTANPMEYAEASKVSLYSIADYCWNMEAYDSNASWLRSINHLMPENAAAFKIFCENNIDLGVTYHGLRRENESAPFKTVAEPFMTSYNNGTYNEAQADELTAQFQSFRNTSAELISSTSNQAMINEIKPWLQVFDIIGNKGLSLMKMYKALNTSDTITFIKEYQRIDSLETVQKTIRSRDFAGSIKNPNPTPANEVVAVFIKKLKSQMVLDYRRKFNYMESIFPQIILEEGRYYIKYNGLYLTNPKANDTGGYPSFITKRDTINPQRQEWTFSIDPTTDRYKVVNTQDSRYINELGNFGTNIYEAIWHTYNLYRMNGKYAIQNAGSAGDKYWKYGSSRINPSDVNAYKVSNFMFELVPVEDTTATYPSVKQEESYYIKSGNTYLTNNNVKGTGGTPTFKALVTPAAQKQQWNLTVDATTNRYKLVSAADQRYVNETGVFGTNAYYSTWNSYSITEMGGKFAIQNAGDAGTKFWTISSSRINTGDASRQESYIFELVSASTLFSTGINNVVKSGKYSLDVSNNTLKVTGDDVASMNLINLNGISVRSNADANTLPVNGIESGIYILTVTSPTGSKEVFKLLIK